MKTGPMFLVVLSVLLTCSVFAAEAQETEPGKGDAPKTDAVKEEMQKLQGTWRGLKMFGPNGQEAPEEGVKGITFEFKDGRMTGRRMRDDEGTEMIYVLDPSKRPKWIDFDPNMKSHNAAAGIYKIDGDELTICLTPRQNGETASPRPTEFNTKGDGEYFMLVLKRVTQQ